MENTFWFFNFQNSFFYIVDERCEVFFTILFYFQVKVLKRFKNFKRTLIHWNASGIIALFEFNLNSSALSQTN